MNLTTNRKNQATVIFGNTMDAIAEPYWILLILLPFFLMTVVTLRNAVHVFLDGGKLHLVTPALGMLSLVAMCIMVFAVQLIHIEAVEERYGENLSALTENITKKYEVAGVIKEGSAGTPPLDPYSVDAQQVIVVTPDNDEIVFQLSQDSKTFEPTLSDMPAMSGSAMEKDMPGAKDLLRKS